jgi:hypothetical protein
VNVFLVDFRRLESDSISSIPRPMSIIDEILEENALLVVFFISSMTGLT